MKTKSKIAITGSSGFVGSYLGSYLLKKNYALLKVGRFSADVSYKDFNMEKTSPYDSVIHLAGKAHDLRKTSNDNEYFTVNRDLTIDVYRRFLASNATNFVFVSSVKAVADEVTDVLTEEHEPNPRTAYGKSKLEAEKYILDHLPHQTSKRVFVLRPCMIHGPGNKGNLNLLYGLIKKGIPYPFGAYKNQRSFLSIENLCFVIEKLVSPHSKVNSGVYQVADSSSLSTVDLVKLISVTLKKKSRVWNLPKSIVGLIGKIGNVLPLPVNEEKIAKLTENYVVSNAKIVQAMGEPLPCSLENGLQKTIYSFQENEK